MNLSKLYFFAALILLFSGVGRSSESDKSRLYPYVFKEVTGDNQFILSDGRLMPIRAFARTSNADALQALQSLSANIVYPNADGTKIFLRGSYDGKAVFTLEGWFLLSPFLSSELIDETSLPHRHRLVKRVELKSSDFSSHVADPSRYIRSSSEIDGRK